MEMLQMPSCSLRPDVLSVQHEQFVAGRQMLHSLVQQTDDVALATDLYHHSSLLFLAFTKPGLAGLPQQL